jgi:ribosomal protein S18 acetylase RimI-like enzyme
MNRIDQPEFLFLPNGHVDVKQLIALYRLVGWDSRMARTIAKTQEMLAVSRFYVAASTVDGVLAGFARVGGDPYVAQVLDVITHPSFRRRGIATQCMGYVIVHLRSAEYASVTLTDGSGIEGFYEGFGFRIITDAVPRVWSAS